MGRIWFPALVCLAAYYALFGGEYSVFETHGVRTETERARTELAQLGVETDSLAARADALENDPRTLETVARENFGMIRKGEILYRFADRGAEDDAPDAD